MHGESHRNPTAIHVHECTIAGEHMHEELQHPLEHWALQSGGVFERLPPGQRFNFIKDSFGDIEARCFWGLTVCLQEGTPSAAGTVEPCAGTPVSIETVKLVSGAVLHPGWHHVVACMSSDDVRWLSWAARIPAVLSCPSRLTFRQMHQFCSW